MLSPALLVFFLTACLSSRVSSGFVVRQQPSWGARHLHMAAEPFELVFSMPPTNSDVQAKLQFDPILNVPSEIIEVRYKIPFGLNVEPKNNLAICTKDGDGGERVGDVLRFCSAWSMGLPQGEGISTIVAAFSGGGLKWQCSMFDVMKSKSWEEVVEALTSNVESRTDEVVLLFERPLEEES